MTLFYILLYCPRFVAAKSFPSRLETAVGGSGGVAADNWDRRKVVTPQNMYSTYTFNILYYVSACTLSSLRRFIFGPSSHWNKNQRNRSIHNPPLKRPQLSVPFSALICHQIWPHAVATVQSLEITYKRQRTAQNGGFWQLSSLIYGFVTEINIFLCLEQVKINQMYETAKI